MGINFEKLGKRLHDELDKGINKLKSTQTHFEKVGKETESAIHSKLEAAKKSLELKKDDALATKSKIEDYLEEKSLETKTAVNEWKLKNDIKKLEKRAEKAEKQAESAIALALYYAEEAEVAILGAVAAQIDVADVIEEV